jgi:hypothetical protein
MSRINGAGVLLPQHEAQAKQQEAAISMLRLQVAGGIVGQLLPQQLQAQATRARQAVGISDDSSPVAFDASESIDKATNLAIATADALLTKLGIVAAE